MASKIVHTDLVAINQEEAKKLAEAIDRVNTVCDFSMLSPQAMAWLNLATVAGGIYVPRAIAYSIRPKPPKKGATIEGVIIEPATA